MKVTKKVIMKMNKCYSLALIPWKGVNHLIVAAEKQDPCLAFDLEGNFADTVWKEPGGTMSIVPLPGFEGKFLATQRFYSPNDSKEASIVLCEWEIGSGWSRRELVKLPFVHRFDILVSNNKKYLIACTIKSGHEYQDDWSYPGKVYVASLPDDLSDLNKGNTLELTIIKQGLYKNHGFYKKIDAGGESAIIASQEGVHQLVPPKNKTGWGIFKLTDIPASDALLTDIDDDGMDELILINPFHGDQLIFMKLCGREYKEFYRYPQALPFLHALYGTRILGKTTLIFGCRGGDRGLFMLQIGKNQKMEITQIDHDCGSANVIHYIRNEVDIIVSANRETDEIAMYTIQR